MIQTQSRKNPERVGEVGDGHNVCTMRRKQRAKGEQRRGERSRGAICGVMDRVATEPPQPASQSELKCRADLNGFLASSSRVVVMTALSG